MSLDPVENVILTNLVLQSIQPVEQSTQIVGLVLVSEIKQQNSCAAKHF